MSGTGRIWVGALVLALAMNATAASGKSGLRFRCEAKGSQQHYCSIDTTDGITLVKQLSGAPCLQGRNWDYDRHGVWVSHRCRGEFITGKPAAPDLAPASKSLRCESRSNRIQRCAADTRGGVRLTRILSTSDCVQNRDWGYDENGVWTMRGCRAEFRLGPEPGAAEHTAAGPASRLTCESVQQRLHRCPVVVRHGVQLLRNSSRTRCVEGANWGWDASGVWVDKGCRAEFRVH